MFRHTMYRIGGALGLASTLLFLSFSLSAQSDILTFAVTIYDPATNESAIGELVTDGLDAEVVSRFTYTEADGTTVHASPAFSPDGTLLLYGATPASSLPQLYIQNVASGLVRKLTDDASVYYRDAVWSPDGAQIAFAAANQGEFEDLYVMDADGTNVVRLTETPELSEIWLAWSPDGETLVYVERDAELAYRLAVIPAAGGASSPLGEPPLTGTTPKWSHDGSRIFFAARDLDAKTASVVSVAADGSDGQTLLTLTGSATTTPAIDSLDVSPDGGLVAFIQSDFVTGDSGFTIHSSLHLLDPVTGELTSPVWITDDVWAGSLDFKPGAAN